MGVWEWELAIRGKLCVINDVFGTRERSKLIDQRTLNKQGSLG